MTAPSSAPQDAQAGLLQVERCKKHINPEYVYTLSAEQSSRKLHISWHSSRFEAFVSSLFGHPAFSQYTSCPSST